MDFKTNFDEILNGPRPEPGLSPRRPNLPDRVHCRAPAPAVGAGRAARAWPIEHGGIMAPVEIEPRWKRGPVKFSVENYSKMVSFRYFFGMPHPEGTMADRCSSLEVRTAIWQSSQAK
jgi:hypothetical protein